jgi:hypothetical protein
LLDKLGGTLHFGRLNMKPGKPTTFVTIAKGRASKLIFAMPGNPVSAFVCTQLLVRPCLDLLFEGPERSMDTHGESMAEMIYRIVQNAWIHGEVSATLTHDIQLDKQRPEYHRVTLQQGNGGRWEATSTGVQRSSRLISLRDAQGLAVLPQGLPDKMTAKAGEHYTVLLLSNSGHRTQVWNSSHLNRTINKHLGVGVVHVISLNSTADTDESLKTISARVGTALSGSKSGPVKIISQRSYSGEPNELFSFAVNGQEHTDVFVIVCHDFDGSYQYHLDVSSELRKKLHKVADAMALQARRGAASEDPSAALFETVVGSVREGHGAVMICLTEKGLHGGLQNVRGLLKHALKVGRGKHEHRSSTHHHRHHHQHHEQKQPQHIFYHG